MSRGLGDVYKRQVYRKALEQRFSQIWDNAWLSIFKEPSGSSLIISTFSGANSPNTMSESICIKSDGDICSG